MFAYLVRKLRHILQRAEDGRRDNYLEASVDLCDLERRIRTTEIKGHFD